MLCVINLPNTMNIDKENNKQELQDIKDIVKGLKSYDELQEKFEKQVHIIQADLLDAQSLEKIPNEIDIAYYLVHSMSSSVEKFTSLQWMRVRPTAHWICALIHSAPPSLSTERRASLRAVPRVAYPIPRIRPSPLPWELRPHYPRLR